MSLIAKRPVFRVFLTLSLFLVGLYFYQLTVRGEDFRRRLGLKSTLANLQIDLAREQERAGELKASWKGPSESAEATGLHPGQPAEIAPKTQKSTKPSGVKNAPEWFVRDQLGKVSRYITVSEDEAEKLAELLRSGELKGGLTRRSALPGLERVLGYERAADLVKRREEEYEGFRRQKIDNSVYVLGRRLSLDPLQEEKVRLAIQETKAEIASSPIPESAGVKSSETKRSPAETLRQMYRREKDILNPKLRDILTEEQYARLLSYQDSLTDNFLF